jgi:NTE family protein
MTPVRDSPFAGLRPYTEADEPYFFGRERDSGIIASNLRVAPLTVLYAPSGTGKTSVLRAGVLKALRPAAESVPVYFNEWQLPSPSDSLKAAVAAAFAPFPAGREPDFEAPLDDVLAACAATGRTPCLLLDQFEEFLARDPGSDPVRTFERELASSINREEAGTNFLVSMREDWLARLDRFLPRVPDFLASTLRLQPLDRLGAERAIREPVLAFNRERGTDFRVDDLLVSAVLDQLASRAGEGFEPVVLQLVMSRIWERERELDSARLRVRTLSDLGETHTIIGSYLDRVLNTLSERERELCARIFERLVTPGGAKTPLSPEDLIAYAHAPTQEVNALLERLDKERVLRRNSRPETYELAHDVLGPAVLRWRVRQENESLRRTVLTRSAPVRETGERLEEGCALCLSGAGNKAVLFQAGVLWRLNQAGWLPRLDRICSVSGSSIASGALGLAWSRLRFDPTGVAENFEDLVVAPLRRFAAVTLDQSALMQGILLPGSPGDRLVEECRNRLFGAATLQDLPDSPRFIFAATNLQSTIQWRFSKAYMGDYRVGRIDWPAIELAAAIAASSAPPLLSPVRLEAGDASFVPDSGHGLQHPPFTTTVLLTDGSVCDGFALESAWNRYSTLFVSDAAAGAEPDGDPKLDWTRQLSRFLDVLAHQTRSLRKRQLVEAFQLRARRGAYWSIRSDVRNYGLEPLLPCSLEATRRLAAVPVRLKALDPPLQQRLINWGFILADLAFRAHQDPTLPRVAVPYPGAGVG